MSYEVDNNASTIPRSNGLLPRPSRANALPRTALWLEADRMGYLVPAFTEEKLELVRSVVKNERRTTDDDARFWCRGRGSDGGDLSARASLPASDDRIDD